MADRFADNPYKVVEVFPDLPVYKVKEVGGSRIRTLHRNLLLPIASEFQDSVDVVQPLPVLAPRPIPKPRNSVQRIHPQIVNEVGVSIADSVSSLSDSEDTESELVIQVVPQCGGRTHVDGVGDGIGIDGEPRSVIGDPVGEGRDDPEVGLPLAPHLEPEVPVIRPRRSLRKRVQPSWHKDYIVSKSQVVVDRMSVLQDATKALLEIVHSIG